MSERPAHEPDWLLSLKIEAPTDCAGPAIVTGLLQWEAKELTDTIKQPTRILIATAGVRVLHAELNSVASIYPPDPREPTWRAVPLVHYEGSDIVLGKIADWTVARVAAQFRLKLMAASTAGFDSCFVISPTVASFGEELEDEAWTDVSNVPFYVEGHRLNENLGHPLALDAAMEMSVPHQEPDRAALEAGARVQRKRAILACTTHERGPPSEIEDQYYDYLTHLNERFCASVETFRATNASVKLVERDFLSTILIAVAVSLLVQALVGDKGRPAERSDQVMGARASGSPRRRAR
jgi:hypothetical protein